MIDILASFQYLAVAFFGLLFLLWIVFELFSRPLSRKDAKQKARIYSCGMGYRPEDLGVSQHSFFDYMRRFLGSDRVGKVHSGRLSKYMSWIMIGTAFIMAMALVLW